MADEGVDIEKSNTTALKLNNNLLNQWEGFTSTMHRLFVDPARTLAWIDLSFNDLRSINEVRSIGTPTYSRKKFRWNQLSIGLMGPSTGAL